MGCADTAQSPVSKRLRIPLEKDLVCVCVCVGCSSAGTVAQGQVAEIISNTQVKPGA